MTDMPTPGEATSPPTTAEAPIDERTARRDAILLGMLPDIPFDGWTRTAMMRGAVAAGFDGAAAAASFPGGPAEAAAHFSDWADREMLSQLAAVDLASMRVRDRVTKAVWLRLEILAPYREAVRRSLALLALPQHAGVAPKLLYRTVDAIWAAAGDTSTDYNFYTKRMLLAGVVTSTTLYWMDDRTEGFSATQSFLDRRIEDVMRIGKGIATMKTPGGRNPLELLNRLPNPVRLVRRLRKAG